MGLVQRWRQYRARQKERKIAKNLKLVGKVKAIREDRVAAIDFFVEMDDVKVAVPALLSRFEFSLEHGINDAREKEAAMEGVLGFGEAAIPCVREHLAKTAKIAWPIKILAELLSPEQLARELVEALDFGDIALDQERVDKNYDVLCYLRDTSASLPTDRILSLTQAHDERLRFAAVEVVLEQGKEADIRQLEPYIADESEENTRIRQSVIQAYLRQGWEIGNKNLIPKGPLVPGIRVNGKYQLETS